MPFAFARPVFKRSFSRSQKRKPLKQSGRGVRRGRVMEIGNREITRLQGLGALLLLAGGLYSLLPHAVHEQLPGAGVEHGTHMLAGIFLVGIGLLVLAWEAREKPAKRPTRR
jgi:hypothetical protein